MQERTSHAAYDPFAKGVMANPHPFYKELRDRSGIEYIEKYDMFAFARFQDVLDLLSLPGDVLISSDSTLPPPEYLMSVRHEGAPPLAGSSEPIPQAGMMGSPYYDDIRQAYSKPLRPRSVASLKELIAAWTNERLDALLPCGRFDLVQDFGGIVAASAICKLFDLPLELAGKVLRSVNSVTITDPENGGVDQDLINSLIEDMKPAVVRRRAAGADGEVPLIDGMIRYRIDGRPLTDREIAEQLLGVYVGGTETVPKILGHGLMELADRPDQLTAVRADLAGNVPVAVEEMIRFCAPAQWFVRTAHKNFAIAGQEVKAGQRVVAIFGAALRDEREFERPEEFVWNRTIRRVLSFGFGQHHCVGLHLARAELRTMVETFLRRVQSYRIERNDVERYPSSFQWGYTRVPVVVE